VSCYTRDYDEMTHALSLFALNATHNSFACCVSRRLLGKEVDISPTSINLLTILWVVNLIDSVIMHPDLYPLVIKVDTVLNKTRDRVE